MAGCLLRRQPDSVVRLEEAFARFIGTRQAVFVPSGRMGLKLVLESLGIGAGDEVILPSFTYPSVPATVAALGIRPVFVDSAANGFNLDTSRVREHLTPRTRLAIPTHLYGIVCDMEPLLDLKKSEGVFILEDCAQSCGARWRGRMTGTIGDAAYFSFGLTKNFTTLDGGMVASNDIRLIEAIRERAVALERPSSVQALRMCLMAAAMRLATAPVIYDLGPHTVRRLSGMLGRDVVAEMFEEQRTAGPVAGERHRRRPPPLFAAVGLRALARLAAENEARRRNALLLYELLRDAAAGSLRLPEIAQSDYNIFQSLPLKVENRQRLKSELLKRGISSATGYLKSCGSMAEFGGGSFPHAEDCERRVLHLPVYPSLQERDLRNIAEAVTACV